MTALDQAKQLLSQMTPDEKSRLAQIALSQADEVAPGIQKTPDVCGGSACIRTMRIPVWLLEGFRRDGKTEAQLLQSYPSLTARDLANAWAYVKDHLEEIELDLAKNEDDAGES